MIHYVQTDNRGVVKMERWYSAKNKKMIERQKQLRIQEAAPALLEALEKAREDITGC